MERATKAFDYADTTVRNNIAALEKALSEPVQSRAASSIAVEIRNFVRELKSQGKSAMGFVTDAIERGDHDSVSAILGAPPFLSGIDEATQSVLLRIYHTKSNSQTAKRLAALQAAQNYMGRNSGLLFREIEKAVGGDYRKVQMLRKGANASKKAFGI